MDVVFILKSLAGLVVILSILLLLVFYPGKKAKAEVKKAKKSTNHKPPMTLVEVLKVVKNRKSSKEELESAIDALIKFHGKIPNKRGALPHPEFDTYEEIVLRLCHHPSTSKEIILKLDRTLQKENPSYRRELNNALTKGLNARGI